MTFSPADYLDLNHTEHRMLFENSVNAWDALKQITSYLQFRLKPAIQGRLVGKPFISGVARRRFTPCRFFASSAAAPR